MIYRLPSQALMTDETIGNVPILILGNKIDRPEAISEEKLRELFGLYGQTIGKVSGHITYLSGQYVLLLVGYLIVRIIVQLCKAKKEKKYHL